MFICCCSLNLSSSDFRSSINRSILAVRSSKSLRKGRVYKMSLSDNSPLKSARVVSKKDACSLH